MVNVWLVARRHIANWPVGIANVLLLRFRQELAGCGMAVVELRGPHEMRLATAVAACDALSAAGWSFADPLLPAA